MRVVGQGIHQVQVAAQLLVALFQGPADFIHGLDIIHQNLILHFHGFRLLLQRNRQITNPVSQKNHLFSQVPEIR